MSNQDCIKTLLTVLSNHQDLTDGVCLVVDNAIQYGLIESFLSDTFIRVLSQESLHNLLHHQYSSKLQDAIWHQYKTQKRDLFIEDSSAHMISSTNINYLMDSSSS
ncbi:Uncharacterized protein FKW44_007740 [Caligus rogercresseyi]|uniref:Uncharacterized protein n=1 Tax=Caligus rogercresseyi TaxID=217165 RepID=A0A7T8KF72_CALRO|nr:Uncharacterized protein FKW44_007740 [Caligus rogercresseyi]